MEKKKRKYVKTALAIILLMLGIFTFLEYREYERPSMEGETIEVEIKEGMSTKEVVKLLQDKGIIHFKLAFYLKLYRSDSKGKIRYGVYQLNDGMSLDELVQKLVKGGTEVSEDTIVFTVPEGYTIEMIAERLEANGIMTAEEFVEAVKAKTKDFTYYDQLPAEDQVYYQLQGYLFPDTYYLNKDTTAEELVDMMLQEFTEKFDENRQKKAEELNMSVTEVLIRASMVQKETDLPSEYARIAGVINNRLAQNMRIQFDSTVVYAMSEGKYGVDRVTYSDLEYDSPYNTYKVKGLPSGPICNPGLEAIDGVLNAEEHNYLFFQIDRVKNDGSNLFFETYEEHLAASSTANSGGETEESTEDSSQESSSESSADTSAGTNTSSGADTSAATNTSPGADSSAGTDTSAATEE